MGDPGADLSPGRQPKTWNWAASAFPRAASSRSPSARPTATLPWYSNPDAFDIYRKDKQHISFGDGAHKCLGIHLARLEMRVLLDAVLDRLPEVSSDLDPGAQDPHIHGMRFRLPLNLPVRFDPA